MNRVQTHIDGLKAAEAALVAAEHAVMVYRDLLPVA